MRIYKTAWLKVLFVLLLAALAYGTLATSGLNIDTIELAPVAAGERVAPSPGSTPILLVVEPPTPTIAPLLDPVTPLPATPAGPERFQVERSAVSQQEALRDISLILRNVERNPETFVLEVALKNTTNQYFLISGSFDESNVLLIDADGNHYQPVEISPTLRGVSPPGGFAPGAANLGSLTFPRPAGRAPYLLSFLSYEPIQFWLDTPAPTAATPAVPPGDYDLDAVLTSQETALAPITLRLNAVRVETNTLTFSVDFVNTSRQGYDLLVSPRGEDAWLLDAEERQYRPVAVSEPLQRSIAPANGWQPGQANTGTITFPRPAQMAELRFVFPDYNALTLQFDDAGLAQAAETSPAGNAPLPAPTLAPQAQLLADLDELLAAQAGALLAGDAGAYLATFSPDQQAAQQLIFNRAATIPMETYEVRVFNPVRDLNGQAAFLENVGIQVRYTLRGLPEDNPFVHTASYDFSRVNGRWLVSAIRFNLNPPFWWTGEVTVRETDHFLIFTRPGISAELPHLIEETEGAYATLAARGLPLSSRYVAYFSASQADFQELTGQQARVVGAAAWRYDVQGETIEVLSRAFYINGEAFIAVLAPASPSARQLTIVHELAHLALATETRPFTPPWLAEGIAVYYAGQNTPAARQHLLAGNPTALSLVELTRASRLGELTAANLSVENEYIFAGEAIRYLVETYGEDQVLAFYRSYTRLSGSKLRAEVPESRWNDEMGDTAFAGLSERLTAEATRQFFGRSLADLDAEFKAWLAAGQ